MKPIRRELLNGLFVLVLASLIHAAFEAFHVNFNVLVWAVIVMAVAIAVSGYVVFEIALGFMAATEDREKEWLKRVGTPARLELARDAERGTSVAAVVQAVKSVSPGSDITIMYYLGLEGGKEALFAKEARDSREELYNTILEMLKNGTIREFKRIICFDHDVLENDRELEAGILRVGEGPGTIDSLMGDHCRLLLRNKGCSLYVAPVVFRAIVGLYGVDKASITVDTVDQGAGARRVAGVLVFHDPPNGEIIEQFRQIVRTTERRMVAVREIRFSEDTAQTAELATR
jgi:hypothetical protein